MCTNRCDCAACLRKKTENADQEKRLKKLLSDLERRVAKLEKAIKRPR